MNKVATYVRSNAEFVILFSSLIVVLIILAAAAYGQDYPYTPPAPCPPGMYCPYPSIQLDVRVDHSPPRLGASFLSFGRFISNAGILLWDGDWSGEIWVWLDFDTAVVPPPNPFLYHYSELNVFDTQIWNTGQVFQFQPTGSLVHGDGYAVFQPGLHGGLSATVDLTGPYLYFDVGVLPYPTALWNQTLTVQVHAAIYGIHQFDGNGMFYLRTEITATF